MWTAIGAIAAPVIGSMISGSMGSSASAGASAAQTEASYAALAQQKAAANMAQNGLQSYMDLGRSASGKLSQLMGLGNSGIDNRMLPNGKTVDQASRDLYQDWIRRDNPDNPYDINSEAPGIVNAHIANARGEILKQYGLEANYTDPESGDLLKKFSQSDFFADPSYEFRKSEGEKALTRGAAARGLAGSTPGMKDLLRFNSDLASTEYQNAWARDTSEKGQTYNFLQGLAGAGANAASAAGSIGVGSAGTAGNNIMAGGNAAASGILGAASAQNNAIQGGLGNLMYNQRYNNQLNTMKSVFGSSSSGAGMASFMNNSPIDPYSYTQNYG